MIKREREDLWKCLFYLGNIDVCRGCGFHLGCQRKRNRVGCRFGFKLGFVMILASFRKHFGSQNPSNIDVDFECFVGGCFGLFSVRSPPPTTGANLIGGGVPGRGKGRVLQACLLVV